MHDGPAATFGAAMRDHLETAEARNAATLERVVAHLLDVVAADGLVHVGGTGHSTAQVLEGFYRAGGLACVRPLHHPGLSPLEGGTASTVVERASGLAETLLTAAAPQPGELGVIFSHSGANPVPVELGEGLAAAGCTVVAVCSVLHLQATTPRAHRKLDEVAHEVLDTAAPYGDAAFEGPGGQRTAALSSLTGVYLWNLLLAHLVERAAERNLELPLWQSANVTGGDERNQATAARYRARIERL